ncbi:MAG: hypothetical protein KDK09_17710 [Rhodobacteraceae bacterium]|nr:hypothetical protein [Paracoccaceae bacterium]
MDTTHRAWFVHFNPVRPLGLTVMSATPDTWNFPPIPPGTPDENWGQDRALMKRGHFTGFPQHLGTEDFAMFLSQGPIYDRTKEQLCASDGALMRVRHQILKSVREFMQGQTPKLAQSSEEDYGRAVSVGDVVPDGKAWKSLVA